MIMNRRHRPGRSLLVLFAALGGCGPQEYDPRTPLDVHAAAIRAVGCLDLGAAVAPDPRIPRDELLLSLRVGNRCTEPEAFDASAIRIVAQTAAGESVRLDLVDPRHEIGLRHLDASVLAKESIALGGDVPADRLVEICFDFRAIVPDDRGPTPEPLCLRRNEEGWAP
jgi:hypothetical protein